MGGEQLTITCRKHPRTDVKCDKCDLMAKWLYDGTQNLCEDHLKEVLLPMMERNIREFKDENGEDAKMPLNILDKDSIQQIEKKKLKNQRERRVIHDPK